ncbi:MAG: S8 family serine peptidase [bacterium]|nr:S8 family serine peptidase [bacterium]
MLNLPPGLSVEDAIDRLKKNPNVLFAEPDRYVTPLGTISPVDPKYPSQWYLNTNPVSDSMGSIDVDIDAPEGWAILSSLEAGIGTTLQSIVAVVDSGCGDTAYAYTDNAVGYIPGHPDLLNSLLYTNTDEIGATAGSDDDANGLKDDYNGWDYLASPEDNKPAGADSHGTFICGIVGAAWNDTGIAGIGSEYLRILPLRVAGTTSSIAKGIVYSVQRKLRGDPVAGINLSWGLRSNDSTLRSAIQEAEAASVMVYAAAGNDEQFPWYDNDVTPLYPSSYSTMLNNVIGVAATDSSGDFTSFTHFGRNSVQVAAPGQNITSTTLNSQGSWATGNGTSFSAPIVASVGALVAAVDTTISLEQVKNRLELGGTFDEMLTEKIAWERRVNLAGSLAPFYPFSGLAPIYSTDTPLYSYTDRIGLLYGDIVQAISSSNSIAVMDTDSAGNWYVRPYSPGMVSFTITYSGGAVSAYRTGTWRVTGIKPFSATIYIGQTLDFENNTGTSGTWFVENPPIGDIDPSSGHFVAQSEGVTSVYLMSNGTRLDQSGNVVVEVRPISSNGAGCCGATAPPGDPYIPGAVEMTLMAVLLLFVRRRYLAEVSAKSKVQSPR